MLTKELVMHDAEIFFDCDIVPGKKTRAGRIYSEHHFQLMLDDLDKRILRNDGVVPVMDDPWLNERILRGDVSIPLNRCKGIITSYAIDHGKLELGIRPIVDTTLIQVKDMVELSTLFMGKTTTIDGEEHVVDEDSTFIYFYLKYKDSVDWVDFLTRTNEIKPLEVKEVKKEKAKKLTAKIYEQIEMNFDAPINDSDNVDTCINSILESNPTAKVIRRNNQEVVIDQEVETLPTIKKLNTIKGNKE